MANDFSKGSVSRNIIVQAIPLIFAIARGAKEEDRAEEILGNTFSMLLWSSFVMLILCYVFRKPVLYLFGAGCM